MQLRTFIRLPIILAAILAAAPAYAELFKWVDGRGVTNYSNQPPADPVAAKKLTTVEDRISVYTPDPALLRAVEAHRQQSGNRAVAAKIESLERQLEDERRARQYAAADAQAAYDPFYSSHHYVAVPVLVPVRSWPLRNVAPAQLPPGMIAGNTPGMTAGTLLPSRPFRSTPTSRGFATR
jgi:hypothetical protein